MRSWSCDIFSTNKVSSFSKIWKKHQSFHHQNFIKKFWNGHNLYEWNHHGNTKTDEHPFSWRLKERIGKITNYMFIFDSLFKMSPHFQIPQMSHSEQLLQHVLFESQIYWQKNRKNLFVFFVFFHIFHNFNAGF